jgi:asparagine synthase (glutamine-hydrolysing)
MSFLAIYNIDFAPIDLDRSRWKPWLGARNVQVLGRARQVAFIEAGALLSLEDETESVGLDGRLWFIGRIRLDAHDDLCSAISGPDVWLEERSDALTCLRAYARWGDRCLEHLRGDFCFCLWDEARQRLFCGRDQLGVRPLFYTADETNCIVSDSLELIAAQVRGDLDEYWIADFLTYTLCVDLDRTVYKQIKRVPPAHVLRICPRGRSIQKYWTLQIHDPIFYPHRKDYVDRFEEILALAVKDRLSEGRVGISMSGGLDSSTLAAHAVRATGDASRIVAHTCYFEHLMPDEERHFSSLVAKRLGITVRLRAVDDAWYDPHWSDQDLRTPEPNATSTRALPQRTIAAEMAKESRVWFNGEGPDNALRLESLPYLQWLLRNGEWFRIGTTIINYILNKPLREWHSSFIHIARCWKSETRPQVTLPPWLNKAFINEMQLSERARQADSSSRNKHPWHPLAISSFTGPLWPYMIERLDPAISATPLIWRFPYLDLRVLSFLLSVPPIPWARGKHLIREAMRDFLPKEVIYRAKAPLPRDPEAIMLQKYGLPCLSRDGLIHRYIDHTKIPTEPPNMQLRHPLLNVYVLDHWLKLHQTASDPPRASGIPFWSKAPSSQARRVP